MSDHKAIWNKFTIKGLPVEVIHITTEQYNDLSCKGLHDYKVTEKLTKQVKISSKLRAYHSFSEFRVKIDWLRLSA